MREVSIKKLSLLAIVLSILVSPVVYSEEGTRQSWTYGGIEYILPKPADQLLIPTDVPETYEIVSGDTLWDIANKFLNDPFLWPLIWDINMITVPNPHLIFPGQIINLPVIKPPPEEIPADEMVDTGPKMFQLLPRAKLIKSGYIADEPPSGPSIIGAEDPINELSTNDVVYLGIGANNGVAPGDTYLAYRSERIVYHPITKKKFGYMILNTGLLEILATQDNTSTAIISTALTALNIGDYVALYTEEPIPLTTGVTRIDKYAPTSGKLPGYVIDTMGAAEGVEDAVILGFHDIIYIDLGSNNGVLPGDTFLIYKAEDLLRAEQHNKFWFEKDDEVKLPPTIAGELTIFRVLERSSTAIITQSFRPFFVGAKIELRE